MSPIPFHCAACACLLIRKPNSISELLEECIEISEQLPQVEGQHHLARASFKLARVLEEIGKGRESMGYMERALGLNKNIQELNGGSQKDPDDSFETLVPWMLW